MTLTLPIGPVEAFVLVATRVLAVLATSPVMGLKTVPAQARLGLGLLVALILVPVVGKDAQVEVSWTAIASEAARRISIQAVGHLYSWART